jgi:hypothetical protein
MRARQQQTAGNTDQNFEPFWPRIVPPDRRCAENDNADKAKRDQPETAVQAVAHQEADEARRHDQPEHKSMKMRAISERNGSDRQHCNEHRHGQAVNDTNRRQRNCDLVEMP